MLNTKIIKKFENVRNEIIESKKENDFSNNDKAWISLYQRCEAVFESVIFSSGHSFVRNCIDKENREENFTEDEKEFLEIRKAWISLKKEFLDINHKNIARLRKFDLQGLVDEYKKIVSQSTISHDDQDKIDDIMDVVHEKDIFKEFDELTKWRKS